jgi:glycosyltransferase involved in cell wall biosynthesis
MKIHFDNVDWSSTTGPNSFASTLGKCLIDKGHILVDDGPSADISLIFIEKSGKALANKTVQRLDGFWFKPSDVSKNTNIINTYVNADKVVFQSMFDLEFFRKVFKEFDVTKSTVIRNGTFIKRFYESETIPEISELRKKYNHIFVSSSNWHRQKRLKENMQLFEQLKHRYHNSCLVVLGNNIDVRPTSANVLLAGSQSQEICMQLYAAADWMIHLAWLDHCPNVVVHALSQETPVICSSSGGTKELVKNFGHVLFEESEFDFQLVDYDRPPEIDLTQVEYLSDVSGKDHENVDINVVADRYISVFENTLKQ